MVGAAGLMLIDCSTAGLTVKVVEALTELEVTPIVVAPVASVLANPAVGAELLIVATVAVVELQCPVCVRSCVVPSV
jgi:isopentenyl phosphate kinase